MAVAHDATVLGSRSFSAGPLTISHNPVGTPRGVVVTIAKNGTSDDTITGVTYGGVAMTRVLMAQDIAGEPGVAWVYFLGASIPAGLQNCVISYTGTENYYAQVSTLTADADTEVVASAKLEGDQANPQITLDSGTKVALRYFGLFSGLNVPTDVTIIAGCTQLSASDYGNQINSHGRETTPTSGSVTVGWTSTIEDVAMVGVAIAEVVTVLTASANVTLPFLSVAAVASHSQNAVADVTMPFMTVEASAGQQQTATAAVILPFLVVSALVATVAPASSTPPASGIVRPDNPQAGRVANRMPPGGVAKMKE